MSQFSNSQGITKISMTKILHNYCPLGKDWYTNNISIVVEPNDMIPDYIDIDGELKELDSKSMIIEDVVSQVADIFVKYNCKYIEVQSYVSDAVHLPVTVTKVIKK